jgi:hypothetical protein
MLFFERTEQYLHNPYHDAARYTELLIESLGRLNYILQTQRRLITQVRPEMKAIIERYVCVCMRVCVCVWA